VALSIEQIVENEAGFREANERMHAWPERHDVSSAERFMFLCECGASDCGGRIWLTAAEYEAVRADDKRFAVLVGHVFPQAERVVEENERYLLVEKNEEARTVLAETHGPRAS
jgi:hypothetical protein